MQDLKAGQTSQQLLNLTGFVGRLNDFKAQLAKHVSVEMLSYQQLKDAVFPEDVAPLEVQE